MKPITLFFALITCTLFPAYSSAQTQKFDTQSVVDAYLKKIDSDCAEVVLVMKEGWHVNANPSSMDFLIPTKIAASEKEIKVSYPEGHKVGTPLGELLVYSEKISIPISVSEGTLPETISLTAQACDGATCYPPSTWAIPLGAN